MTIWEQTEEKFRNIIKFEFYKNVHGAIITYDVTNQNSFKSVRLWFKEVESKVENNIPFLLIGNKSDKPDREVNEDEGKVMSQYFKMGFFETSAKTNQNVTEAFHSIAKEILKSIQAGTFYKIKKEEKKPEKSDCIII